MALIKCPECGKDVSDTIESCIHCGFVLNKKEKAEPAAAPSASNEITASADAPVPPPSPVPSAVSEKEPMGCGTKILIVAIIAFIILMMFAFCSISPSPSNYNNPTTSSAPKEIVTVDGITDIARMYSEYNENTITANDKYKNTYFEVLIPGEIVSITDQTDIGLFYVNLEYDGLLVNLPDDDIKHFEIHANNIRDDEASLELIRNVKTGDYLLVSGEFVSINYNYIKLTKCTFEVCSPDGTTE